MKKLIFGLFAAACLSASAQGTFNLFSSVQQIQFLQPTNLAGGTVFSVPIDMGAYVGVATVILTGISNGVAGDATWAILHATAPTNAAAGWVPISNACFGTWVPITTTNIAFAGFTNGLATNVINQAAEAYTARATITTTSNSTIVVGIPVRDNNRYWQIACTNSGSSLRALSAVVIARNAQSN